MPSLLEMFCAVFGLDSHESLMKAPPTMHVTGIHIVTPDGTRKPFASATPIDLRLTPTFSLVATASADAKSVAVYVGDKLDHVEHPPTYTVADQSKLPIGSHVLTLVPYPKPNAKGTRGERYKFKVDVIRSAAPVVVGPPQVYVKPGVHPVFKSGVVYTFADGQHLPIKVTVPNVTLRAENHGGAVLSGAGGAILIDLGTAQQCTVDGFKLTCPDRTKADKTARPRGIKCGGRDNTIKNIVVDAVEDFVNCNAVPEDLVVEDCRTVDDLSVAGYFGWVQGAGVTFRRCAIHNSTRETPIRASNCEDLMVEDCYVRQTTNNVPGDVTYKNALTFMGVVRGIVRRCTIEGGAFGMGPQSGVDSYEADGKLDPAKLAFWRAKLVTDIRSESNLFLGGGHLQILSGTRNFASVGDFALRNGAPIVIKTTDETPLPDGSLAYPTRTLENVAFEGGTFANVGTGETQLIRVDGRSAPLGAVVLRRCRFSGMGINGRATGQAVFVANVKEADALRVFAADGCTWAVPDNAIFGGKPLADDWARRFAGESIGAVDVTVPANVGATIKL